MPLIERVLRHLVSCGVRDAVINLHHLPESITGLVGDGRPWGVRIRYSWEQPVLGSAGGPRHALPLLQSDPFLMVNADTLTDLDVDQFVAAHAAGGALVTLAVVPNPAPQRYGGVLVDGAGRVSGFTRAGDSRPSFHFIGVQVASKVVFTSLPDGVPAESVSGIYLRLIERDPGAVRAEAVEASFHDIGTAGEYLATNFALARAEGLPTVPAGRGARIDPGARLVRTIVWDDVRIGDGCTLTDCIVADRVTVPPGTRAAGCAIVPRSPCASLPGARPLGNAVIVDLPELLDARAKVIPTAPVRDERG
jgi:mannose-1-phosphate guanylyltransferase